MRNFKNNFRRSRYKNHSDRNNHKNENGKIINDLQNGSNFIRKNSGRNNHNASKLIEKYSDLAREALSGGDKILSENYFQHAEHFIRVQGEKDAQFSKGQITKEIVKVKEKTDQDQNNTNGINSESLEPTPSTES
tara:strand:+ start:280 stop:684 length:405 start_codon:yes stop_codon:yes gene_type:complete